MHSLFCFIYFLFNEKTAYEMRISDRSSDVCSSDLIGGHIKQIDGSLQRPRLPLSVVIAEGDIRSVRVGHADIARRRAQITLGAYQHNRGKMACHHGGRSEEHTSELQSLMRISYAVFCLKKKKKTRKYNDKCV